MVKQARKFQKTKQHILLKYNKFYKPPIIYSKPGLKKGITETFIDKKLLNKNLSLVVTYNTAR